jgi:hypothetical protein
MDIDAVVQSLPSAIGALTRETADWLAAERPDLTASARTGWGTINYHHGRAGFVLALYPRPDHLSVLFQHGRLLTSPLLEGEGKQIRYVALRPGKPIPRDEIGMLIVEAIALRA